jgi:tungstate transport system ATP-binding protein
MVNILFDIRNLTYYYNGRKALDIPYLRFEKGRVYSIVGPNGAGKTTLLNILAFLRNPSSGLMLYEGLEVGKTDVRRLRMEVTLVHQNPYLFSMTVEKNLAYGLKIRGMNREEIRERVKEGLRAVGLEGMENRTAGELSGGEAQRVALARAFVLRPKLLLLDEPAAHVDLGHTKVLEGIIKEFNQLYGTTVILTTHNILQATQLSDSVIVMKDGSVAEHKGKEVV